MNNTRNKTPVIRRQTIIIDGCTINLNFLIKPNAEIGALVRSMLLKTIEQIEKINLIAGEV